MHTPDDLVPVEGCEDVQADPATAALLARRLRDGELTPDELRTILAGKSNTRTARSSDGYCDESS